VARAVPRAGTWVRRGPGPKAWCLLGSLVAATPALAGEIYRDGDTSLRWDNTLRYTAAFRLDSADPRLIADPNADDGDRNFDPGLVSNRFDWVSELGFARGNFGAEVSAQAWYDSVYNTSNDNDSPATANQVSVPYDRFTDAVRTLHGRNIELLNGFVYDRFTVGSMPATVRIGRHTLVWGESLFFADNGVAAGQAPEDGTRQAILPYARANEVYMPIAQVSGTLQPSATVALGFYYQFEWRRSRLPGAGSYFSVADFADVGGERAIVGPGQYFVRGPDVTPPSAQFGVSLHIDTDAADLGFYALRFNAKYPQLYIHPYYAGAAPAAAAPDAIERAQAYGGPSGTGTGGAFHIAVPPGIYTGTGTVGSYDLVFPDAIQLYGASASAYVGSSSIAAEVSGRRNMPLVSTPRVVGRTAIADTGPHALYAVGDTLHGQISDTSNFGPSRLWNDANLSVEVAANRVLDVTKNPAARDPSRDDFALAVRGVFQPEYYAIMPGVDLSIPVGFGYGIVGNSSVDGGQNERAGDIEFGARFVYRTVWEASITLTHYIGSPARQSFADRDYLAFSIRRTF
jgi:hypothetical protein